MSTRLDDEKVLDTVLFWRTRAEQLQRALDTRIVIEQAKGILAERFRIDTDKAFVLLRASARRHRIKIHDLAAEVVASRVTPSFIVTDGEADGNGSTHRRRP